FSAPVNIVLEKGSRPDTIVPIDSAMSFAMKSGLMAGSIATMIKQIKNDPFLGRFVPDTMGISVVPIVIFLKIKASGTEGVDTLFYFTKTDAMNPPPSSAGPLLDKYLSGISGMEAGDMVYAPVTVAGVSSVRREKKRFDSEGIGVVTDPSSGAVRIDLGRRFDNKPISVRVYSLHGSLIRTLTPAAGAKSILWDGADERGSLILHRVLNGAEEKLCPVGFIDDDEKKQSARISGYKVIGQWRRLEEVIRRYRIDEVLVPAEEAAALTFPSLEELGREVVFRQVELKIV
ncbi:MAG: hypothetical protein ABIN58_08420, partial [candidate division WOR-3 bacterium]